MNKCKRAIYRLDSVSKPFYVYCLYYSKTPKNIRYKKNYVFYVGKSKKYLCKKYKCDGQCTLSPMLKEAGLI